MANILFSSKISASANIAYALMEEGFREKSENVWELGPNVLIDTRVESILEVPTEFQTDLLIVLSTHKSKIDEPIITTHAPGNWHDAQLGGSPSTLNVAPCFFMKAFFQETTRQLKAEKSKFTIGLETDHHGPTCDKPICFVEIGSNEKYFENKDAGRIAARAVIKALECASKPEIPNTKPKTGTWKLGTDLPRHGTTVLEGGMGTDQLIVFRFGSPVSKLETGNGEHGLPRHGTTVLGGGMGDKVPRHWKPAFVVGGGHYPKEANALMATAEYAVGHTLAKFNAANLTKELFRQAVEKNIEGIATVLIVTKDFSKKQITQFKGLASECKTNCIEI